MADRTIQPMGKSPKAAPLRAAASMVPAQAARPACCTSGGVKTNTAVSQAVTRPARAARGADTRPGASRPNSTQTGKAAGRVQRPGESNGSYLCVQVIKAALPYSAETLTVTWKPKS